MSYLPFSDSLLGPTFTSDGAMPASGSVDGTVRLWGAPIVVTLAILPAVFI